MDPEVNGQEVTDNSAEEQYIQRTHHQEDTPETPPEENNSETSTEGTINKNDRQEQVKETEPTNEITALSQKLEQLQKQFAASQQFITKQSMELQKLHTLRKQAQPQEKVNSKEFLNSFVEDPQKALEEEMNRREQARAEKVEASNQTYQGNLNMVLQAVPNIDALIPAMLEELASDGVQNPTVEMVRASIATEPHLVLNYAKRAAYKAQLTQTEQKGKQILEKVANGSKKAPTPQGKSLPPAKERSISPRDLRNMSDAELDKLYKELAKK